MNFEQYILVGSTVRSHLSCMKDMEKLSAAFQDSMLLWYYGSGYSLAYRQSTEKLKSYMQRQWSLAGEMTCSFITERKTRKA